MNPTDPTRIRDFLAELLGRQADPEGLDRLRQRLESFRESGLDRTFHLTFSAVPRYLGKTPLQVDSETLEQAGQFRAGFCPAHWTIDRAARVWLLLFLPTEAPDAFDRRLAMLFDHADMGELAALYSSLPLLPHGHRYATRAAEGIRTNMTTVFDAVALENPYPADYLGEGAWNQLVLKAAFQGRPLYRIQGLDRRANAQLARIISDYAHERWAAGRVVSPELWRLVGPFLDDKLLDDLRRVFGGPPIQRQAAALACAAGEHPEAESLLARHPELKREIENGLLTWELVARTWEKTGDA